MGPEETKLREWIKETEKNGLKRKLQIDMNEHVVKFLGREELCKAINEFIEVSVNERPIVSSTTEISGNETIGEPIDSTTSGISG